MSKSTTKAAIATTTDATATVTVTTAVKVAAAILAEIGLAATTSGAAQAALRTSDQQIIKLALKVRDDRTLAAIFANEEIGGRSGVQAALKPHFVAAYEKAGQTSVYAVEQLSRMLTLAFGPSGAKVTAKQRAAAIEQMSQGLAKNANTQAIIALASGRAKYNAKGEYAKVETARASGNAKPPVDTLRDILSKAITAFVKESQGDALPVLTIVTDILKTLEAIDEDSANLIGDACKEAC